MLLRSTTTCLRIVLVLGSILGRCYYDAVEASHHDKTLLKTNALGYTKSNQEVSYAENFKVEKKTEGVCVNGPPPDSKTAPNSQTTTEDTTCQTSGACHVGFTKKGDWVAYDFHFDEEDLDNYADSSGKLPIEVVIRSAANNNKDREVEMKIYTDYDSLVAQKTVVVPGKGYQHFNDVVWNEIKLDPKETSLRLYIFFVAGNTNLCSIDIHIKGKGDDVGHIDDDDDDDDDRSHDNERFVPFAINALLYDDAKERDNAIYGSCAVGQPPIDEPDAQNNDDPTCRKLGPCHISFTEEDESVTYKFKTEGSEEKTYVDITVRVSSKRRKYFTIELLNGSKVEEIEYFQTKGGGYDEFSDLTWRRVPIDTSYDDYKILITFTEGNINMCSVRIDWSDERPTQHPHVRPSRYPTRHPSRRPTRSPHHHHQCYDDEDFHYDGDNWKDCFWVAENNRCNMSDNGWHIGRDYCPKSCGYCKPSHKPTRKPSRKPTRKPSRTPTRHPSPKPTRKPTTYPSLRPTPAPITPDEPPSPDPTPDPTPPPTPGPTPDPTPGTTPSAPTIEDIICNADDDFLILCATLRDNNLLESLEQQVNITLFAPNDEAFFSFFGVRSMGELVGSGAFMEDDSGLIIASGPANDAIASAATAAISNTDIYDGDGDFTMRDILLVHVTNEGVFDTNDLICGEQITTFLTGQNTTTVCTTSFTGKAQVGAGQTPNRTPEIIRPSINVSNGIIQVINNVIIPAEVTDTPTKSPIDD